MKKCLHMSKKSSNFAHKMKQRGLYIVLLLLMAALLHAEQHTLRAEADRPGYGTGTNVLSRGMIQWETGFEAMHIPGMHLVTLPTTLFRFGLHERAELRVEYAGGLLINDHPDSNPETNDEHTYYCDPLYIGTKLMLWGGSDEPQLRWIPRTSVMLNIGIPITRSVAKRMPISGNADLLFENDITDWLTIQYEFGTHWIEWAPMPDFFTTLGMNFAATENIAFFVENYNYFDCDNDIELIGYKTAYNVNLDFGMTYMPHPRVQLDLYAGFNCYATEPLLKGPKNQCFLGLGVAWLLHAPK